jgi:hypothetical protein
MITMFQADVKRKDKNGYDCLYYYINGTHTLSEKNLEFLIENGGNVYEENTLNILIEKIYTLKMIDYLPFVIKYKIPFEFKKWNKQNNLFSIFKSYEEKEECIKILIKHKIDEVEVFHQLCNYLPNYKNDKIVDKNLIDTYIHYLQMMLDGGYDIHSVDSNGRTALYECKNPYIVKWLLKKGINTMVKDVNGNTAFEYIQQKYKNDLTEVIQLLEPNKEPEANEITLKVYNLTKMDLELLLKKEGYVVKE